MSKIEEEIDFDGEETPSKYPCVLVISSFLDYEYGTSYEGIFVYNSDTASEIEINNTHFLGYDENDDGDFDNYYICPKCKENNHITRDDNHCDLCLVTLKWKTK